MKVLNVIIRTDEIIIPKDVFRKLL